MKKRTSLTLAVVVAMLAVASSAPPAASAAPIRECGNYGWFSPTATGPAHWGYGRTYGAAITNLTTRNVRCAYARPFATHLWGRHHYKGYTCKVTRLGVEYYDIRCTKGNHVIHWQNGA